MERKVNRNLLWLELHLLLIRLQKAIVKVFSIMAIISNKLFKYKKEKIMIKKKIISHT